MAIFLTTCKKTDDHPDDLSVYYLTANALPAGGMIYSYANILDTSADPEVWQHSMTSKDHISSINYDYRQQVVQKQFERIAYNGVVLDSLILFFPDSLGVETKIHVRILAPNKFPFDAIDSSKVWLTKLEWWQPGDSLHVVLERRRRFMGHTSWMSDGKPIPAVRFRTEDKFETEEAGWTTSAWSGEEIYAEGIGLVHYTRNISNQLKLEFELVSRTPVPE